MKKILLFVFLAASLRGVAQNTTQLAIQQQINHSIDSFSHTMDSIVVRTALCPTAAYITLDTLSLQPNTYGFFTLTYACYDTVQHYIAMGEKTVSCWRIGTGQALYYIWPSYNVYPETTGLSVHQTNIAITYGGGQVIVNVDGFGPSNPIRWHLFRTSHITQL